jgi:hypothetical protein
MINPAAALKTENCNATFVVTLKLNKFCCKRRFQIEACGFKWKATSLSSQQQPINHPSCQQQEANSHRFASSVTSRMQLNSRRGLLLLLLLLKDGDLHWQMLEWFQ